MNRSCTVALVALGLSACRKPQPAPLDLSDRLGSGQVRAGQAAKAEDLLQGPDARGRIGDFKIYNSRVAFIIQNAGDSVGWAGLYGGNLVDADLVRPEGEPGREVFLEQSPVVDFLASNASQVVVERDGREGGPAVIAVTAREAEFPHLPDLGLTPDLSRTHLDIVHRYILDPDQPYLTLTTEVSNSGDTTLTHAYGGDAWLWGGRVLPFFPGRGFTAIGALDSALAPQMLARGEGVSYVAFTSGPSFGFGMILSSVLLATVEDHRLAPGGRLSYTRYFGVGGWGIGSALKVAYDVQGVSYATLGGSLLDDQGAPVAGAHLRVEQAGVVLSDLEPDESGRYEGAVPTATEQTVDLVVSAPGRLDLRASAVVRPGERTELPLSLGAPSRIAYRITGSDGAALPARLTLVDAATGERSLLLAYDGVGARPVSPGIYDVWVSRGFEYELKHFAGVTIAPGTTVDIQAVLARVVDTTGYLCGDFHVHSETSPDSRVALEQRVASLATEGLEWAVSTDHDYVTDYAPAIERLGLDRFLKSSPGEEVSTVRLGHFNGWPLQLGPGQGGNGALRWAGLSPAQIFGALRARGPDVLVQVNHPRSGMFSALQFDPASGRFLTDPASVKLPPGTDFGQLDIDALEVINGKRLGMAFGDRATGQLGVIDDYLSLLRHGHKVTLTGNSDSHSLAAEVGYPRNFVASATDEPLALDPAALVRSVRTGHVVVSGGAFATLSASARGAAATAGDLLSAAGAPVTLSIRVQAPDWVGVDRVELWKDGTPVQVFAAELALPPAVERLNRQVVVSDSRDAFYMVLAFGIQSMAPVVNATPFAITNPVFIDADGDGVFTP